MPVNNGTGVTVTFGTSGFTANIESVEISGLSREAIQTSHHGTTSYHTFIPAKLVDPGELSMDIQFDPDDYPPITGAAETITVTFPLSSGGSTAATWSGTGFVTGFTASVPLESMMTGTLTVKFTGSITATAEA